jgi:hypothetical protein
MRIRAILITLAIVFSVTGWLVMSNTKALAQSSEATCISGCVDAFATCRTDALTRLTECLQDLEPGERRVDLRRICEGEFTNLKDRCRTAEDACLKTCP